MTAVLALLAVFTAKAFFGPPGLVFIDEKDHVLIRTIVPNILEIMLFIVAILSAYIGYRLIVAAGATHVPIIPPADYELLAPLIADGKTDAINEYIKLSSLRKFTGSFTQLGLTGLPLATIFLTLLFSALTLYDSANFVDLTKLTLGAFIGSFVQRQVERRADAVGGQNSSPGITIREEATPRASA
ncbi:hypothetical protein [Ensifer sp.]|uniref:hypothetical protein n=1 Tax=Ensifer sp. TaxID=1872086 RepID=UPI002E0D522B